MPRIVAALFIVYILLCFPVYAAFTVIESTPSRLVLGFEMTGFDTLSVNDEFPGGLRTRIYYDGGTVHTGDSGAVMLPGVALYAGVPGSGEVRVSVVPEELTTVRINRLLARRSGGASSAPLVFRSRWVSEPSYSMFRDYRAAVIVLRPVSSLGQERVQLLKRARIIIDFPAAPHTGASWAARNDFERMAERLLPNFSVAQGWQERAGSAGLRRTAAASSEPYPFAHGERLASFRVGAGSRGANEGSTAHNGLARISGRRIRELFGQDVHIGSVKIYASVKGEMPVEVPREGAIPAGVFEVPVLRYDLNGNGIVDDDDYFIAYVSGSSDWGYNSSARQFNFELNRFDDRRTFWVSAGSGSGRTMERFSQPAGGGDTISVFDNNLYIRTPTALSGVNIEGGPAFAWRVFRINRADTTINLDLPGLVPSRPGSIQLRYGHTDNGPTGGISILSAFLGTDMLCDTCGSSAQPVSSWGATDLTLRYRHTNFESRAYRELNSVHVRYGRSLRVSRAAGRLEVFSSATPGAARYRLSNDTGGGLTYIVRVPLDESRVSLVDTVRSASYVWSDTGSLGVRYMVVFEDDIVDYSGSLEIAGIAPTVNPTYQIRDLWNVSDRTDFMIITPDDFLPAALRFAEHKRNVGFARPRVVLLDDILNQFGGGNMDPAALRNFLLYVYRHWDGGDFDYVSLFGTGHYDYKQIVSRVPNYMPVPYVNNRLNEEFYVFLDTIHPGMQHVGYYFLGRFTARSLSEAFDMVDKVIETEDPRVAEFDAWRNRVLMTADDDQQGPNRDPITYHHDQSDKLADKIEALRPDIDLRRLHLFEYQFDERYFKPAATRTLINEINNGVAMVSWFGHGSMDLLADARLLQISDIAALHNRRRYPLFALFSCSPGKYDQPGRESISEVLLRQPRAGAIATVAGAREVSAFANEELARTFYRALFDTTAGVNLSFGSALQIAKMNYTGAPGNRFYVVLGDPSITLTKRNRSVNLSITDASGTPIDTLKALQEISISGVVMDAQGRPDAAFGTDRDTAFVNLTLFNPPQISRRKDGGTFTDPIYTIAGSPVFSARIPVENGRFEQQIRLPMNLAFERPGVRLTAYAWKSRDSLTGSGHIGGLIFYGSESGGVGDTSGPKISVRPIFTNAPDMNQDADLPNRRLFVRNRITAQLPLTMEISIDGGANGVNVTGTGPDEGLTMEVRGALSRRSINHLFQFSEGGFRQGIATVTFEENSMKSGTHEMIISAQDLLGNVSKLTVALDIVDPTELKLDHVINVPNPVRMGRETRFFYHHSNASGDLDVQVTIRIYTLGGRLVAVIRNPRNGEPWIPRDQRGNLLTPNVYLYQVTASSPNIGRTTKSKIKKLVVHPPR